MVSLEKVNEIISSFFCPKDPDIEDFLKNKNKAIQLEKLSLSRTYLLFDEEQLKVKNFVLLGYFTLALNIFHFDDLPLSKSQIKKFMGFAQFKEKKEVAVYLIGQLAKNQKYADLFDGKIFLEYAFSEIRNSKKSVDGRLILVESKNLPNLIEFYHKNDFTLIREDTDQLLQFIRVIG
jgi:hypothetical protein